MFGHPDRQKLTNVNIPDILQIMKESGIQNLIRIFMSGIGIMNWRNNTGTGWVGKCMTFNRSQTILVNAGDVVIRNARPLRAGLCTGSSDIIGITPTYVTHDMLGKTLGVFTAIEVKGAKGVASKEQKHFIEQVIKAGGYAGVAKTNDDIAEIIKRY